MKRNYSLAIGCLAVGLSGSAGSAADYTISTLVIEGDDVPGVGLITTIDNIAVNDAGQWLVEADTNNADTDTDSVLLMDGILVLREGDALTLPAGATLDSFDSVTLSNGGNRGHNHFLADTTGTNDDSGVYWNDVLIYQESNEAPLLTPGTPLIGFFDVKINAENLFIVASVDDPVIESSVDRALYVVHVEEDVVTDVILVAKEGDILAGQTEPVADFGTGPHASAFNELGDVLFFADLDGDSAVDGAIYINETLLAQEGSASPVSGRNWSSLSSPELDLSNRQCHVYSGSLDGDSNSNLLIVKNGAKFRQEGDTLDAIGDFTFTSFGSGPVEINDRVEVLWYGDWNNADTTVDEGLFLEDELLIHEGVTILEGSPVDTIRGVEDGYHMSDSGEFIIAELILSDGRDGAFLLTRVPDAPTCDGDVNGDGAVDPLDAGFVLARLGCAVGWGCDPDCDAADINYSGDVDPLDVGYVLARLGTCD